MDRYTHREINNPTESQKKRTLSGYDEIASAKVFFDGKGNFAVALEANVGLSFVTSLAGKSDEETKAMFQNTLGEGAEQLCNYLKKCYVKGLDTHDDELYDFLRKLGAFK